MTYSCTSELVLYEEDYIGEEEEHVDMTFVLYCELETGHKGLHSAVALSTGYNGDGGKQRVYWE